MKDEAIHVPKLVGGDTEFGNYLDGTDSTNSCADAATLLLAEIKGRPDNAGQRSRGESCWVLNDGQVILLPKTVTGGVNEQDLDRRYDPKNGGCIYRDMDHVEGCLPEILSARAHLTAWHALTWIVRDAQDRVNARLPEGSRLHVLVRSSDGHSNSYGNHTNFLITRQARDEIFDRRLHTLLWLASFQASSIIFAGQGKVGAENGAPACNYQLSQRADFFEQVVGWQTTERRPIVNSRDEAHCGGSRHGPANSPGRKYARLHCIFYDAGLCHVSHYLRVGCMQIVLTMIEAGAVNPRLALADPVAATVAWSHDPTLSARAEFVSGRKMTALELQLQFCEAASKFVGAGKCDGLVPEAREIVALWSDTLEKLRARDLAALTGRLDWVLKLSLLHSARRSDPALAWDSPEMQLLDQGYGELDGGLFWDCLAADAVDRMVSDAEIERAVHTPPENTRAWTRSKLLQLAPPGSVADVDWDEIIFSLRGEDGVPARWSVSLDDPLGFTAATSPMRDAATFEEALVALEPTAVPEPSVSFSQYKN